MVHKRRGAGYPGQGGSRPRGVGSCSWALGPPLAAWAYAWKALGAQVACVFGPEEVTSMPSRVPVVCGSLTLDPSGEEEARLVGVARQPGFGVGPFLC